MNSEFLPREDFAASPRHYKLLPFRFMRLNGKELLVNEAGEYLLAPIGSVNSLVDGRIEMDSVLYKDLKAKQFVFDRGSSALLDILATKYRTKFHHLQGGTKLHIFVVTLRCEHSCHYCQVSRQTASRAEYDMTRETADRSLSLMMNSPAPEVTLELQGGEPLLVFNLIRYLVPRAKKAAAIRGKSLQVVVATNLACLDEEMLRFFRDEGIKVSTSLDGPESLHNRNRPRPGADSYRRVIDGIQRCREALGTENVSALMTTTAASLDHPIEIVDEYVRRHFHSIFLRPISPYGFALRSESKIGYETNRFLDFYEKALSYIIRINKSGYYLSETYATILLTKILTPFSVGYVDLQSPAGAMWNVLVYNYNGDVFASDESRMLAERGDLTFKVGNVYRDSRENLFTSDAALKLFEASCNQSLPGCSDCAFQSYCGADPVYHHATQGTMAGHRPTSGFCVRNMRIIRHLFEMIDLNDPTTMHILWSWIAGSSIAAETEPCA